MPDFAARLRQLGLTQAELRRWIEETTGHRIAQSTTSNWARGVYPVPAEMDALLAVLEVCKNRGVEVPPMAR